MKLSEIKGEAALDLLADILDPAVEIMTDPNIRALSEEPAEAGEELTVEELFERSKEKKLAIAKALLKDHKGAIIKILARLEGVPVEEYQPNIFALPMLVLDLLNDEDLMLFFESQEPKTAETSSIAPTENTKAKEK